MASCLAPGHDRSGPGGPVNALEGVSWCLATVRTVTAEPLPRAHASAGTARALVGDAPAGALVLAAAVPFLFLHATYQPSLSGRRRLQHRRRDARRRRDRLRARGGGPPREERGLAAARPRAGRARAGGRLRARRRDLARDPVAARRGLRPDAHAISVAKFAWYATLLPATVLLVRSTRDLVPLARAVVAWSVAATSWGLLQFLGIVSEFEGKRPGQREPSFVGIHDFAALSGRPSSSARSASRSATAARREGAGRSSRSRRARSA